MTQTSLFDRVPVSPSVDRPGWNHRDADETEVAGAFASMQGSGEKKLAILRALYNAGPSGLTDYQLEMLLDIRAGSVTSLRNSLEADGYVEDAPFTRRGRVGTKVRVRRLTQTGRNAVRRAS